MGRTRRVISSAIIGAAGVAVLSTALGSGVASTQVDPASRAIQYLQTQQSAGDGSIPVGSSTASVSEAYAIAAAAAGYDPSALRQGSGPSVMAYLAAHAGSACATAGGCGELIQAVVAAGLDPAAFGGVDLLTSLAGLYDSTTGAFGDGEAFTQALAIQALVAAGRPVPAAATGLLAAAQDSDGGWDFLLIKDDPNGSTDFDTSDTNSTAMVLMALDAAGRHSRDGSALAWLHTQQDADGGFPYQAGSGTDPDSTALVLQAVLATGQDPAGSAWAVSGHTPLADLITTQDADGGFTFPGNPAPDPFTTSQVPLALARSAYPLACGTPRCFQPGAALSGPAPSPTPRPTGTPRPTPRPHPSGPGVAPPVPVTSPTGAVAGSTATPTPTAAEPTALPGSGAGSSPAIGSSPPPASAGFPVAAVYGLAALAAAVIAAGLALGVRRLRGG